MIQQTSLSAYRKIGDSLQQREREVLNVLTKGNYINSEIAKILGLRINSITGRITRLKGFGLVVSVGKKVDPETGHECNIWGIGQPKMHQF